MEYKEKSNGFKIPLVERGQIVVAQLPSTSDNIEFLVEGVSNGSVCLIDPRSGQRAEVDLELYMRTGNDGEGVLSFLPPSQGSAESANPDESLEDVLSKIKAAARRPSSKLPNSNRDGDIGSKRQAY